MAGAGLKGPLVSPVWPETDGALVTAGPGSPSPPTRASVISRTVRAGPVAARTPSRSMALITALLGSGLQHLRLLVRGGWGVARGPAGWVKGWGSRTALPRLWLVPSPGQPRPRPGWGGGCCWAPSRPLGAGGRAVVSLPPPPPATRPPASDTKWRRAAAAILWSPRKTKAANSPGQGPAPQRQGGVMSTLEVRPPVLRGGPGGPGQKKLGGAGSAFSGSFLLPKLPPP